MYYTKLLIAKVQMNQFGKRLDSISAILFPQYSRTKIKKLIIARKVKVDNSYIVNPKKKLKGGEIIKIQINKKKNVTQLKKNKLNILYEDYHFILINKPSGLVVHPGCKNNNNTLLDIILHYYPDTKNLNRSGIVHRLDKNTTGLMIIAKTYQAQNYFYKELKNKKIIREYRAIVHGKIIFHGTISAPIMRDKKFKTLMKVDIKGKPATTHYQIIKSFSQYTYLKVYLETGRTHQIRVHMAHIEHPVVGDIKYIKNKVYCYNPLLKISRQALHARKLKFMHPTKRISMQFKSNLPEDMYLLLKKLIFLNKR
ncbi:23S rRNA pseudouridine synthase [Wigglesworthia glossinidia endosymbiont of Glossina morsitans morsitans (Yale colony)]|uniref:Pseudouridine synthase n=1 Tax=Wigglesworthia glossinidia endosymbiont of Glossina morsitans morsitans (Yale colony) TaxID=1142511 RepID=H6Q4K2_WIGGL|nr:RluA family pseudouridine synthase [Wigglesworthia glossinidia]AFA41062.1 23S rRNA pseudouridine synthase [Wigglesworthia glossinidia endosymbiont of Glossina morsitans morsitans (Yale colony)]